MKILQINTTYKNGGSTGRIASDLKFIQEAHGIDGFVAFGYEFSPTNDANTFKLESIPELKLNILKTRLLGKHGFYNVAATKRLIKYMDEIKPDIIHLHNIHNHYVNAEMLFNYIKKYDIPVVWTLHDCWSFTGWCAYFDYANCSKWKTECHHCPSLKDYPYTWFFDRSSSNYKDKRNCFNGVRNLTIVTPSKWLANLTNESFLKKYPIRVINNGVDIDVFYPRESNLIQEKYGLGKQKIILAMANGFSKRKGIEYLLKLTEKLDDSESLVIVGVDKHQIKNLPPRNCIGIPKTNNLNELAELYSVADVFINPTLEDNFPTTNIEALACGTPIVTFNTGGSIESIDSKTGLIVPQRDIEAMLKAVRRILEVGKKEYIKPCREKAVQLYNKNTQYAKYIELYNNIKYNK